MAMEKFLDQLREAVLIFKFRKNWFRGFGDSGAENSQATLIVAYRTAYNPR